MPCLRVLRARDFPDVRGTFVELFREEHFAALGIALQVRQVNLSRSKAGVVRGLHFQWDPPQAKLMRVVRGRAMLYAVDVRHGSPTLGRPYERECSSGFDLLWGEPGFARGFCALEDDTEVEYLCSAPWRPEAEGGIRWSDPAIGLHLPLSDPIVTPKDADAPTLAEWLARPESWAFRYA